MTSRRFAFSAVCALIFAISSAAFAQERNAVPAATSTATGKLVFTFTVTIDSTIPANSVLGCTAVATIEGYQQTMMGLVKSPVAGKNTCTVTMPYSWVLATESTDKIGLTYKVEIDYGYEFTASNGTDTSVQLASTDKVTGALTSISVPTAASTSIAVSATI